MADTSDVQQLSFTPGQQFLCSTGIYSDYEMHGCYEALQSFDAQMFHEFCASMPSEDRFLHLAFLEFLVEQGYVRKMPIEELYLGRYGAPVFMLRNGE